MTALDIAILLYARHLSNVGQSGKLDSRPFGRGPSMRVPDNYPPFAGDLFGEMQLAPEGGAAPVATAPRQPYFPGLAACAAGAAAAAWLSERYGFPIILLGLLVGLSLNFVSSDPRTHWGLDFASRTFLRFGIVTLGLQVSFAQVMALGWLSLVGLLLVMALAMAAGLAGARMGRQSNYAGLLAGGSTAICGASAALALYGVIGKQRLPQSQFALTLVGVSLASALAMTLYPIIAHEAGFTDQQAGFLIGASIHDVAQAIGGGFAFSDAAGNSATIVKLARVALLAPIVALVSAMIGAPDGSGGPIWRRVAVPWFILAFLALLALNSMVAIPRELAGIGLTISKVSLLLAVTATAMRTRLDLLLQVGWSAAIPVAAATLTSFAAAFLFAWVFL
jgi:uncharacterized integral membrane protein (TIGR00698 family)